MKTVLCYPAVIPGQKPGYGLQPLGVLYLAGELKRHGIDAQVIDAEIEGLTIEDTVGRILAANPDFIGFSIMTPQLMSALAAATLLKRARPDLPIAFGGAHLNATHEDIFSFADCLDLAAYGEGEVTIVEVIRKMEGGGFPDCLEGVPGIIYRDSNGRVVKNSPRQWLMDLDCLPRVDYGMLDITKYRIPTMVGRYVISMVITRGCPFKCIFCNEPTTMGARLRMRSMDRTVDEIMYNYKTFDVRNFVFKDSTFTAKREWVVNFCESIINSDIKINWRCNARVDTVDDELLRIMKRAGCHIINLGVESGDPQILKNLRKGITLHQIERAHELTHKYGIRTYSTFLVGSPGETEETIRKTIEFAKRIRPSLPNFFVAVAYPGTVMYEHAVKDGLVKARWWVDQNWDTNSHSAFQKRWGWAAEAGANKIPGFDSGSWQQRAIREFYFRPQFIWDTMLFTVKNPYFFRHLVTLGIELIPFYKVKLPWKK